jgi:hypothetical protein
VTVVGSVTVPSTMGRSAFPSVPARAQDRLRGAPGRAVPPAPVQELVPVVHQGRQEGLQGLLALRQEVGRRHQYRA